MKPEKDVLLIGRPDHSLLIYDALLHQDEISYNFITFKVLPRWLRTLTKNISIQYVGNNVHISWRATFINVCKYVFHLKIAEKWKERGMLRNAFLKLVKRQPYRIIHYWSTYASDTIEDYATKHPGVITLKDIYMPSFVTVYEAMKDVCNKYNLAKLAGDYKKKILTQTEELKNVQTIIVPSRYVLESYKRLFPHKNYLVVSYGVSVAKGYAPKKYIHTGYKFKFVYAGRISLEKGADLLLAYFAVHPEFELHVYGNFVNSQKHIFEKWFTPNIVFHGNIPKFKLQNEIMKYDVGIHLSRFDAYSLAVSEIIGCGLPVIVSRSTGIEDDVKKNRLGYVTDNTPCDIDNCVRKITDITNYNSLLSSVQHYLTTPQESYGEKMVSLYKLLIYND